MTAPLEQIIAKSCTRPVPNEITIMAAGLRDQFPAGAIAAVLAYGSCLRDTAISDTLADFYVLTYSPRDISSNLLARFAGRILPPNVYTRTFEIEGKKLACKYAVTDIATFGRWMMPQTRNPYFWARFAQPCAIIWAHDDTSFANTVSHLATAATTMLAHCPDDVSGIERWKAGFSLTYLTELRPEGPGRATSIVDQNRDYYRAILAATSTMPIKTNWPLTRFQGKLLSVLRLIKAAFTFAGGAEYIAWKISRHSGTEVTLTGWQRRHPVLAALYLLPGLLRKGAIR